MEPDDSALWQRVRGGDANAFGLLFERHGNTIYNFCFRRVGNWAAAEDLLSVVFLECWRRRDAEIPTGMVVAWLYGIATNVLRNQHRSERRYAAALMRIPEPPTGPPVGDLAAQRIDDERQMQRVLAFVRQLPRRELEVFALCGWFELTYEDAALALGIPVGTVRSRLSRARKRLQEVGGMPIEEVSGS